ncbi:MAG: 50S ribosomal protein L11 methyltransferase [Chloroflexota bacterium]|jgi:ribosomal protein L11 methyltransferase
MDWLEVSVVVDGEGAEVVAETLRPYAYGNGVVLEQRGDASNADPNALEPEVTVKIFLPDDIDIPNVRKKIEESLYYLGRLYPIPPPSFRHVKEEDWANAWRKHYHPFRVGERLWIHPSWQEPEGTKSGDVVVAVDPGMAFGTGLHPSTKMCLQQLDALVRPGMRVMDVGTGSGILSVAAAKLGAKRVLAFDTDYRAVVAAAGNAALNNAVQNIRLFQGELNAVRPSRWDLVVINILAPVIVRLLGENVAQFLSIDGSLILSGIIEEQEKEVLAVLDQTALMVADRLIVRDWVCLTARKK